MQMLRSILFIFLMYLAMAVIGILGAPFALWSRDWTYRVMKFYCHTVFWLMRVLCGLRYEVRGQVPDGPVMIGAKHQSFLDILILASVLPRFKFIMKQELRWAPILGLYAMRVGSAPVHRGRKGGAVKQMMSGVEKEQDEAGQIIIYPQGTRVPPGTHIPYKVGAGVIYDRLGQTCYPAATNVGVFWPKRGLKRYPGTAVIEFLEPIAPGLPVSQFVRRLEHEVETASNRLMREAGFTQDLPEPREPHP